MNHDNNGNYIYEVNDFVIADIGEGEFMARVDQLTDGGYMIVDQDDNGFRVSPDQIVCLDERHPDEDEHDQFRNDVEADADALRSAGFDEGENDFDERM